MKWGSFGQVGSKTQEWRRDYTGSIRGRADQMDEAQEGERGVRARAQPEPEQRKEELERSAMGMGITIVIGFAPTSPDRVHRGGVMLLTFGK